MNVMRRGLLAFVIMAAVTGAFTLAPVRAAPGDANASQTLSLQSLGFGNALSFYGLQGEITLTIPVPDGTRPTALTATVELPPNLLRGYLTVTQADRTIVRMPLPENDLTPIRIPLVGVEVVDHSITIRLRAYLIPPPDYCLYDPTNPLRLTNVGLQYDGPEAPPAVVADFLPPVLQKLTIFIPSAPSLVESDSALRLTTAVVAHYGQQDTQVTVAALDGPSTVPQLPAAPFERQIVVREGPNAGVSLQGDLGAMPSLLVTGGAGDIVNQIRLLTSDLSRLAMSAKAIAGPLQPVPEIPADLTTIADLGQPGVNATDLTDPRVSIPIDQTRLGRLVHGVRVHLQGTYTPLPATLGGQVVVGIAGQTIAQWPTDPSGAINKWIDVPDNMLKRYNSLDVEVQATGNTGRCGEYAPIRLVIDGATAVQTKLADPPQALGFQSLPQALMPQVQVGLNGGDKAFADTVRAASILEGLQHLSARPLDTVAVAFDQAVTSPKPAILIAADRWDVSGIPLPVSAGATGPIKVRQAGGDTTLTLDPAQPIGSLQTVYSEGRSVLVATSNGNAGQLDSLLTWLDQDRNRWSSLDGNVVIGMPGRDPVTLNAQLPQAEPASRGGVPAAVWWGGGVVLAAAIAAAALWARRRGRPEANG